MSSNGDAGPIRILLGPSPWLLPNLGAGHAGLEIRRLRKAPVANSPTRDVNYDADTMEAATYRADAPYPLVLDDCIRDPMCAYLAERERKSVFDGPLSMSSRIAEVVAFALQVAARPETDAIVFHNYPHELFTYVLLKVARRTGIPAFLVHFSVIPWMMRLSRFGPDLALHPIEHGAGVSSDLHERVDAYYRRLLGTHREAMPAVDRQLLEKSEARFLSFAGEMRGMLRGNPVKPMVRIALKHRTFAALQRVIVPRPTGKYVVFFLHYQPEESTMPRGGIFGQQMIAIAKLRSALPDDVQLIVKEHPSMFRHDQTLSIRVRSDQFYRFLRQLRGVHLVSQATDTFELIDDSVAVATITGTVAVEALARGRPVICLGAAYYRDFSGVLCLDDLGQALAPIPESHESDATRRDLLREAARSFDSGLGVAAADGDSQFAAAMHAYEYFFANARMLVRSAQGAAP